MFKRLFTRRPQAKEIRRYVEMEYAPAEREAAFDRLMREARH